MAAGGGDDPLGRFKAEKSVFSFCCGKKGSGKSELAKMLYRTYPYDRLAIDPTHDLTDLGADVETIDELPGRFPVDDDGERVSLRYTPDIGSPTYNDDLDRAVGLALYHPNRRCFLLADEIADLTTASKTPPHMRRALAWGRHKNLHLAMCNPRPKDVNPLVISQADFVYVFRIPHPLDQERVAACIGWPPGEFAERVQALDQYEYLRYDALNEELTHWPPLPLGRTAA